MISFENKVTLEHGFPIIKLVEAKRNDVEDGSTREISFNGVSGLKKGKKI